MGFAFYPTAWDIAITEQLRANERLVLLAVVEHANGEDGTCFPSHERLAEWTGVCERTVGSCLRRLEDLDLIEREKRGNPYGGRTTDLIRLLIPPATHVAANGLPDGGEGIAATRTGKGVTGKSAHELPAPVAEEPHREPFGNKGKGSRRRRRRRKTLAPC